MTCNITTISSNGGGVGLGVGSSRNRRTLHYHNYSIILYSYFQVNIVTKRKLFVVKVLVVTEIPGSWETREQN